MCVCVWSLQLSHYMLIKMTGKFWNQSHPQNHLKVEETGLKGKSNHSLAQNFLSFLNWSYKQKINGLSISYVQVCILYFMTFLEKTKSFLYWHNYRFPFSVPHLNACTYISHVLLFIDHFKVFKRLMMIKSDASSYI